MFHSVLLRLCASEASRVRLHQPVRMASFCDRKNPKINKMKSEVVCQRSKSIKDITAVIKNTFAQTHLDVSVLIKSLSVCFAVPSSLILISFLFFLFFLSFGRTAFAEF